MKKARVFWISITLLALFIAYLYPASLGQHFIASSKVDNQNQLVEPAEIVKKEDPKTHTILLVGDLMLDRGVELRVRRNKGDWSFPYEKIMAEVQDADIAFANLEGVPSDIGRDTGKKYSFRFDPASIFGLRKAGFDIVSLANNHTLDWGRNALCDGMNRLSDAGIATIGAGCNQNQAEKPHITNLDETKIAWLAFTEFYQSANATIDRPGLSLFTKENMERSIRTAEENADLVFVSMHWGVEYESEPTVEQRRLAHELIDAGADIIIGHHPHVEQEIEKYKGGYIIYSLGNFIFDQYHRADTMRGIIVWVHVQSGKVMDLQKTQIKLNENYQPRIDQIEMEQQEQTKE